VRVILDTNALVSGIFFGGVPGRIIDAWTLDRVSLVLTPEILEEYARVGREMASRHPDGREYFATILDVLAVNSPILNALPLPAPVCTDPDDDKFLAAAMASGVRLIVSGDKHLLTITGWQGVEVMTPREFVREHLPGADR
jgi:putative PIN family toxin of toxin-antitoxin system